MLNDKAPSVSGFTKQFYVFFWIEIGQSIADYINEGWRTGSFFYYITPWGDCLAPKKGDKKVKKACN